MICCQGLLLSHSQGFQTTANGGHFLAVNFCPRNEREKKKEDEEKFRKK